MDLINLKAMWGIFTIILLCSQQITAGNSDLNDATITEDTPNLATTALTSPVTNTTSDVEEFIRGNVSDFISTRKKFIDNVPKTRYIASAVLELLGTIFPDYTFSTKDNYLQKDYFYTGYGQQILTIGNVGYRSQIRYYCKDTDEQLISVISLRLIYDKSGTALCETIGYTENPESDFLHYNEPNSTINAFRDIMAMEKEVITTPVNVFSTTANNGEIPVKQAHCCLVRLILAAITCCTCGTVVVH